MPTGTAVWRARQLADAVRDVGNRAQHLRLTVIRDAWVRDVGSAGDVDVAIEDLEQAVRNYRAARGEGDAD